MLVASHPEADAELAAAAHWYEDHQPGLGGDFLKEFELTLLQIKTQPDRWRPFFSDFRKLNFDRFPYAIVYRIQSDTIFIIAVMHLRRRPLYWLERPRLK